MPGSRPTTSSKSTVSTPAAGAFATNRSSARQRGGGTVAGDAVATAAARSVATSTSCQRMATPAAASGARYDKQQAPTPFEARLMAQTVHGQGKICCDMMSLICDDARVARTEMLQSFQALRTYIANFRPTGLSDHHHAYRKHPQFPNTPLDAATINRVLSLKVGELRKELVRRGEDECALKNIRKQHLQHQLLKILEEEHKAQQQKQPLATTKRAAAANGDDDSAIDVEPTDEKEIACDENHQNSAASVIEDPCAAASWTLSTDSAATKSMATVIRSPLSTLPVTMESTAQTVQVLNSPPKVSETSSVVVVRSARRNNSTDQGEEPEDSDDVPMLESNKDDDELDVDLDPVVVADPRVSSHRKSSSPKPACEVVLAPSETDSLAVEVPFDEIRSEEMEVPEEERLPEREPEPLDSNSVNVMEVDSGRKRSRSYSPKPMDGDHGSRSGCNDSGNNGVHSLASLNNSMIQHVQSTLNNLSFDKSPIRKQAKTTAHGKKSPSLGKRSQVAVVQSDDSNNGRLVVDSTAHQETALVHAPDNHAPKAGDDDTWAPESLDDRAAKTEKHANEPSKFTSQAGKSSESKSTYYEAKYNFTANVGKTKPSPPVPMYLSKSLSASQRQQQFSTTAASMSTNTSTTKAMAIGGGGFLPNKSTTATAFPYGQSTMLERMRNKAAPSLTTASAPVSTVVSSSSFEGSAGMPTTAYGKRQAMTMKVREKALGGGGGGFDVTPAAGGGFPKSYNTSSYLRHSKAVPQSSLSSSSRPEVAAQLPKSRPAASLPKPPQPATFTSKSAASSTYAASPSFSQTWKKKPTGVVASSPAPKKDPSPPETPYESYMMTDSEDEGSDDDSLEPKPKKRYPEWTRPANLAAALHYQFTSRDPRMDPDNVFGDFSAQTCDLVEMFGENKERYKRRGSSGNWSKDRLTEREKSDYKRSQMEARLAY